MPKAEPREGHHYHNEKEGTNWKTERELIHNNNYPTLKQYKLFDEMMSALANGETPTKKELLRRAGYGEYAQRAPHVIFGHKGFQMLLARVDDSMVLGRMVEILMRGKDGDSLKAANMIMELKNRYPKNKAGGGEYENDLSRVTVDEVEKESAQYDIPENASDESSEEDTSYGETS